MSIVRWDDNEDCFMSSKEWGKMVEGEFISSGEYQKGDFPIVWCDHDGCPCTAIYGKESCTIYSDHMNE